MTTPALALVEPDDVDDAEDQTVLDPVADVDDEPEAPGLALYVNGEPPDEIDVDTTGLPPQRARLARYQAWVEHTKAELNALETGRAKFLESVGAPAVTEAKIAALIESDRLGLVSWMRSGAAGITPAQIRSFERQKLEEALADDRHAAEVAKAALADVEREIRDKRQHVEALEERRTAFAEAAVMEVLEGIGAVYRRQADEMRETLAQLYGANSVIGALGFMSTPLKDITARLPNFHLRSIGGGREFGISIAKREIQQASGQWRDLLQVWADDARAAPPEPNTAARTRAADEPEPEPLADRLQAVVDLIADGATGLTWDNIGAVIAEQTGEARMAADADGKSLTEDDVAMLASALVEALGPPPIEHATQARLASFSATAGHRIAAAAWFVAHPEDRPADGADIVDVLS